MSSNTLYFLTEFLPGYSFAVFPKYFFALACAISGFEYRRSFWVNRFIDPTIIYYV